MGAVNPDSPTDAAYMVRQAGLQSLRLPFTTTTVSNSDTHTLPRVPAYVAWEPTNTSDQVAATFSGTTVTFSAPAGSHNGHLLVWMRS